MANKETNRDFKGVWIPKGLYLAEDLSWTEKILLIEIQSLDKGDESGCFASNEYLGKFLGIKGSSAANMISKLKRLGYLKQVFFDGRNRGLRVTFDGLEPSQKSESRLHKKVRQTSQKSESEPSQKSEHSYNSNELAKTISKTKREEGAETASPPPKEKLSLAVEIYQEVFPVNTLDGYRLLEFEKRLPEVNEQVWRKTLEDWKLDGHKSGNISGMIDRYEKELARTAKTNTGKKQWSKQDYVDYYRQYTAGKQSTVGN